MSNSKPLDNTPEEKGEKMDEVLKRADKLINKGRNRNNKLNIVSLLIYLAFFSAIVLWLLESAGCANSGFFTKQISSTSHSKSLSLSLTKQQNLILLLKSKNISELRLISPSTGRVQDISLGDKTIVSAALSPDGEKIGYISEKNQETHLFIYKLNSESSLDNTQTLSKKIDSPLSLVFSSRKFNFCDWGELSWNTRSNQLAFFGCSEKVSQLYLINTGEANAEPWLLPNTAHQEKTVRKAIWLQNDSLVYTTGSGDNAKIQLVSHTVLQEKPKAQRLYGEPLSDFQ